MDIISVKSKVKKRVGRGLSSGQGKTAGRGTKGQKSRSGYNLPRKFEGGQTPLSMRLAKLPGFKSIHKKAAILSLDQISSNFKDGDVVSLKTLVAKNLIRVSERKVKILNNGELSVAVTFDDVKISKNVPTVTAKPKVAKTDKVETETTKGETVETESPVKKPVKAKKPTIKK